MISSHLFDKLNFLNYFTHEAGKITCLLKVGKSQKVFLIWLFPQLTKYLTLKVKTLGLVIWIRFLEDGAKFKKTL